MQGRAKFALGKIEREVKVTLGLAPEIEEATGLGLMTLSAQAAGMNIRLAHAAEIVRIALKAGGVVYSRAEILDMAQHEGPVELITSAAIIMSRFFDKPEGLAAAKQGNRQGKRATVSH